YNVLFKRSRDKSGTFIMICLLPIEILINLNKKLFIYHLSRKNNKKTKPFEVDSGCNEKGTVQLLRLVKKMKQLNRPYISSDDYCFKAPFASGMLSMSRAFILQKYSRKFSASLTSFSSVFNAMISFKI